MLLGTKIMGMGKGKLKYGFDNPYMVRYPYKFIT